jgi:hypothetical protein
MESWRGHLSERKVKKLETSWAGVFRHSITPKLPVEYLSGHFSDRMGRRSKELVTVLGAVILQQIFDLTDEETCDQLAFNQQWHYALDCFDPDEHMVSLRTLWNVRSLVVKDDISKSIFNKLTDSLSEVYRVDHRFQRIDSTRIESNMARLGRMRLMLRVIVNFLRNLKRSHPEIYQGEIADYFKERYGKGEPVDVKPSQSKEKLKEISSDLYRLILLFQGDKSVESMYTYRMMVRVFGEQCKLDDSGQVLLKPNSEIPTDSLQNPSDPDATYDSHKGQGYKAQIMETYTKEEDKLEGDSLNLITHVEIHPAHVHDTHALKPALEEADSRGTKPEQVLGDTHYGGEKNKKFCEGIGVKLIAPVPGPKPEQDFEGFSFDRGTRELLQCPNGYAPEEIRHNRKGTITAYFKDENCGVCPIKETCPVKQGKRGFRIRYRKDHIESMFYRREQKTERFQQEYKYRAGIEATNSRYVNMTGVRRLRYRGLKRVKYAAILKALGINLFRVTKFLDQIRTNPSVLAQLGLKEAYLSDVLISVFRKFYPGEKLIQIRSYLSKFFGLFIQKSVASALIYHD